MAMKQGTQMALFFVGILVVGLILTGRINLPFLTAEGGIDGVAPVTTVKIESEKSCGSTTMTMDFVEKYNSGVDVTSQNGTVWINGAKKGVFSEGGTFTVQGGDDLTVVYALDDPGNTYYASQAVGKVRCTGQTAAFLTSAILDKGPLAGALQDPAEELYKSSTVATTSVFSDDDNVLLSSTALAIGAGATETAKIIIKWKFEEGYGVVDGNTLACRFTDSQIDQEQLVASIDGNALTSPAKYVPTNTRFPLSAGNESVKTWNFPAIDGKKMTSTTMKLNIKGDDTKEPTARTNLSCAILDTDVFELDAGGVAVGVEDSDDNTNVGRGTEVLINLPLS